MPGLSCFRALTGAPLRNALPGVELWMTLDHAVALSLLTDGLPKPGLTARLLSNDPELLELAAPLIDQGRDVRRRGEDAGIRALPWNDPAFPRCSRPSPTVRRCSGIAGLSRR